MLKKSKIVLYAALIGMLCVSVWLIQMECQPAEIPFYLEYESESGTERYACWRGENQQCYVFVPGYVDFAQSRIVMNTSDAVWVAGKQLDENTDCAAFQVDTAYEMTYDGLLKEEQLNLMFMRSGDIAVVHIDTESGSMDFVHAQKGNEEKADIRIYTANGALVTNETLKSIAARGNSTFGEEKKPYIIKFTENEDVLGMGAASKWILLANAFDPTNMRNQMVLETADKAGMGYTPDTVWVELYLNGRYAGLYLLSEKIEVNENRVEIPTQESFLFSLEDRGRIITQNLPHYETRSGQVVRIRYPELLTEETAGTLGKIVQRAENAILAADGIDPDSGASWDELIDVDSWARKYLVEEIFANVDAGKWSQYFYTVGSDKRIYAGPVWDYDLSLAISWNTAMPNAWYCNRMTAGGEVIAPWLDALSRKPAFMQRVVTLYEQEFLPILMDLIDVGIREMEKTVLRSNRMNAVRWSRVAAAEGKVEYIETYLQERVQFLNDIWIAGKEYVDVTAYLGDADGYVKLSVEAGAAMNALPKLPADDFLGWYHAVDGSVVEPNETVEAGMQIYAVRGQTATVDDRVIKLIPLGLIAMLGAAIMLFEFGRLKKVW